MLVLLFSPVFVEEGSSPIRIKVKNEVVKEDSPQREVAACFFKLKARRSKASSQDEGKSKKEVTFVYEAESVHDGHIKVIESLNLSMGKEEISSCMALLNMVKKVKDKRSTYAGKANGSGGYDKLWKHGVRKLVAMAAEEWRIPMARPVLPLIRSLVWLW